MRTNALERSGLVFLTEEQCTALAQPLGKIGMQIHDDFPMHAVRAA
jgi:hypothetical protein